MKKSIIFLTAAMALGFAACKEDTSDLGIMQKNPAPDVVASNGVATSYTFGHTLDLNGKIGYDVPFLDVAMNSHFPESAIVTGTIQLSKDADFSDPQEVPYTSAATTDDTKADAAVENPVRKYHAVVEGTLLENAFVALYGNSPAPEECYLRYNVMIDDGSPICILPYEDGDWWPAQTVTITPLNQNLDVYPSYVIYGPEIGDGTQASGVVMTHSSAHEWDDPVFSGVIDITEEQAAAGFKWRISPVGHDDIFYGPDALSFEKSGRLALDGEWGVITTPGPWKIEVNMLTKIFTISSSVKAYWVPCTGNNNSFARNIQQVRTEDFKTYSGFCYIDGFWALCPNNSLGGTMFMKGDGEGKIASTTSPLLNAETGIPMPAKTKGLYYLDVDLVNLSYKSFKIETIGLCGTINNWGKTPDIALKARKTDPAKFSIWTVTYTFTEKSEVKFRANSEWESEKEGYNWGGDLDNLTYNGGNIVVEPGTYDITLDLSGYPWKATFNKK